MGAKPVFSDFEQNMLSETLVFQNHASSTEDSSEGSSLQLSHPQEESAFQAEKTLKREGGEGEGGVRIFGRLKDRVNVSCMVLIKQGAPCKNPASWALGIGGLEVLVCGTYLKRFEKHSKGIGRIEKLTDHGFSLKRREESDDPPGPSGVMNRGGE